MNSLRWATHVGKLLSKQQAHSYAVKVLRTRIHPTHAQPNRIAVRPCTCTGGARMLTQPPKMTRCRRNHTPTTSCYESKFSTSWELSLEEQFLEFQDAFRNGNLSLKRLSHNTRTNAIALQWVVYERSPKGDAVVHVLITQCSHLRGIAVTFASLRQMRKWESR